jgi:hypothetical protein
VADALDAMQRPLIDAAYTNRPSPTAAQLAASTSEQAKIPSPVQILGPPEPVATANPPPTASVLASSTNRMTAPAPGGVATNLVTSASPVSRVTAAPRPSGVRSGGGRFRGSISLARHQRGSDHAAHHKASRGGEPRGRQVIAASQGLSEFR